ncbi:hypothetical protein HK104_001367 [Borealophlyctis nickersoniae]|nr:hypothetical protein HK104_001367 [Borealophlyctis nickersoniae]
MPEKVRLALFAASCFLELGNEPAGVSNEEEGERDGGGGGGSGGRGRRLCGEGIGATAMVGYPESKGKSSASSAACLPQEILLHILRLVPRQRRPTILACCLVNKAWHQAAMYLLWEVLDTDVDSLALLLSPGIVAKASNTRSLHLYSVANYSIFDDYSLTPIVGDESFPFSNLRALAMERVRFDVFDLAQIFDACPNIVVLAIDLWDDNMIDDTVDASLRAGFGRLQSFAICERQNPFHDHPIRDADIPLISLAMSSFGSSLRALVCGRCRFTSEVADAIIKNCPHLRRLVMDYVTSSPVNYFIEAGPPRTIEALGIENVQDAGLRSWCGADARTLHWIKSAGNCRHTQEYDIWELKRKCPSLEKILVKSLYAKTFMEAARRKGVDVRPRFWRKESSVFIDPAKQWIGLDDDE